VIDLVQRLEALVHVDELEKLKLHVELRKASLTLISLMVPLVAAVLTFMGSVFLEHRRASADFELKAAEIVMNASTPAAAVNKAIVLRELFPEKIPKDFPETMQRLYKE
jgi:hypothetical protein